MPTATQIVLVGLAIIIAACRVDGFVSQSFQFTAHFFVGGLIATAIYYRPLRKLTITLAVVLSVVETLCFFFLKH